ncbi:MAG: hypothetical protein AABW51_01235 [Nanoarchaeota archaeon]
MKDLLKKLFGRETKPEVKLDESDREAFSIVAGTFNVSDDLDKIDWRNVWGLSKDSGLSETAVGTIIDLIVIPYSLL